MALFPVELVGAGFVNGLLSIGATRTGRQSSENRYRPPARRDRQPGCRAFRADALRAFAPIIQPREECSSVAQPLQWLGDSDLR